MNEVLRLFTSVVTPDIEFGNDLYAVARRKVAVAGGPVVAVSIELIWLGRRGRDLVAVQPPTSREVGGRHR